MSTMTGNYKLNFFFLQQLKSWFKPEVRQVQFWHHLTQSTHPQQRTLLITILQMHCHTVPSTAAPTVRHQHHHHPQNALQDGGQCFSVHRYVPWYPLFFTSLFSLSVRIRWRFYLQDVVIAHKKMKYVFGKSSVGVCGLEIRKFWTVISWSAKICLKFCLFQASNQCCTFYSKIISVHYVYSKCGHFVRE